MEEEGEWCTEGGALFSGLTTFERVAVEPDRDMTDFLQNETTVQKGGGH
jgi:hypothetical protein